jgi:hypothetical protein
VAAAAQAFLVVVFVAAGVAKLLGRSAFLRTLGTLRWLPPHGARVASVAVPVVELATAALLIVNPAAGALAALGLTALFTGVVVGEMVAGRKAPCGCFGEVSAAPVGPATLVRNLVLAAAAVVLYSQPYESNLGATFAGAGAAVLLIVLEAARGILARGRTVAR